MAVAAAMPLDHDGGTALGEEAGTQDKYVDGIAAALTHVHANSMEEMNAQWAKESANSHWHCKHCHSECKTQHCHRMCSDRFCSSNYAFKKGSMDMLVVDGPVTPAYAKAIHDANLALEAIKTAKTDKEFEIAEMALQRAQAAAHADQMLYQDKAKMAEDMDKSVYGSRQDRQAEEDKTYLMEQNAVRVEQDLAKQDTIASSRDASQNAAYAHTADTVQETNEFEAGTSMLDAVGTANSVENDELKSMNNKAANAAREQSLSNVASVAAEMERVGVKAAAAASEAENSADDN